MSETGSCIFCEILDGTIPSSPVYRDRRCVAFMDIRPINDGHLLVVPIHHTASLSGLDDEDGAHLFRIGRQLAQALRQSGLPCDGVNFHLSDGKAAGQEVFHVHLHVIPRFFGDGFGLRFGPRFGRNPARTELNATAEKIKKHLIDRALIS